MNCPACAGELEEQRVGGVRLHHCEGCRGALVAKADVRALSKLPASEHPALRRHSGELVTRATKVLVCPRCEQPMLSYAFGGGNTRAEGCEQCELTFFDGGELAAALEEVRSGIKMSEDTRTLLHGHRAMSTWDRIGRAEVAMISALGLALVAFITLTRRGHASFLVAGIIAFAIYVIFRWRSERAKIEASKELDELIGKETADAQARERAAAPQGPWAPERSASRVPPAAVSSKRTRACPFCSAQLSTKTTHCDACDSDFG